MNSTETPHELPEISEASSQLLRAILKLPASSPTTFTLSMARMPVPVFVIWKVSQPDAWPRKISPKSCSVLFRVPTGTQSGGD